MGLLIVACKEVQEARELSKVRSLGTRKIRAISPQFLRTNGQKILAVNSLGREVVFGAIFIQRHPGSAALRRGRRG
jgi:hypothetical protein